MGVFLKLNTYFLGQATQNEALLCVYSHKAGDHLQHDLMVGIIYTRVAVSVQNSLEDAEN